MMAGPFSDATKLKALEREIALRRNVYAQRVQARSMRWEQAEHELGVMRAIANDYEAKIRAAERDAVSAATGVIVANAVDHAGLAHYESEMVLRLAKNLWEGLRPERNLHISGSALTVLAAMWLGAAPQRLRDRFVAAHRESLRKLVEVIPPPSWPPAAPAAEQQKA